MTEVVVARVDLRSPAHGEHRRRDIQGLRALAVLMVVAFHARLPVPGGFTGVDVFFVISGFVITSMLHREFTRRRTIALATFYGRRFLRLTPALALLVACVAVASALLQSPFGPQQATAQTGLGAMLLSANLVIAHASGDYFATDAKLNPLLNTWSLSVEEQFYLVFPTVLLICWWIGSRLRRPGLTAWVVLAITIASFWLCLIWTNGDAQFTALSSWLSGPQTAAFYFAPARAWEFGIGALLAVAVARSRDISRSITRVAGPLGLAMILIAAFGINDQMPFPGVVAVLPVLGTALAILAGCQQPTVTSRVLGCRPFVAIGDVSYSWYLWHWPVIVFVAMLLPAQPQTLAIAAVASLIPATISYVLVEQPLRRWRPRRPITGAAMGVSTLAIPIALCIGLLAGAQSGWGVFDTRTVQSVVDRGPLADDQPTHMDDRQQRAEAESADPEGSASSDPGVSTGVDQSTLGPKSTFVSRGCVNTAIEPSLCTYGPRPGRGTVVVIGDSQAYSFASAVIAAAGDLGYRTLVSSRTGCPFLARPATGFNDRPCAPWQQESLAYLDASRPDVVVIANRSGGYVQPGRGWRMIQTASGGEPGDARQARASYADALTQTVEDLRSRGIAVVIVGAVPEMTGYIDQRSLLSGVLSAPPFTVSRSAGEEYRRPAFEVEQQLATEDPAVISFDPNPALCGPQSCSARDGGEILYEDQTHLSPTGAMRLVSGLRSAILAASDAAQTPAGQPSAP